MLLAMRRQLSNAHAFGRAFGHVCGLPPAHPTDWPYAIASLLPTMPAGTPRCL